MTSVVTKAVVGRGVVGRAPSGASCDTRPMRATHTVDLAALARVFGSHDEGLVGRVIAATDAFTRERLAGCVACGFDPGRVLTAIVAGDVTGVDAGAVHQLFDVIVHHVGTETTFLDESWASDRILTAIDKAKVNVDRGLKAPLPWPIQRSSTGVPMVWIWSTADLQTLAAELETARGKVAPELANDVAAIAARVAALASGGTQVVVVDWL